MSDLTNSYTWEDLKKAINALPDELLKKPVYMWGVESGCTLEFEVLDEDYLNDGEGCVPRTVLEESQEEPLTEDEFPLAHLKGTIIMSAPVFINPDLD